MRLAFMSAVPGRIPGRKRFRRTVALWLTGSFVPAFLSGTAKAQDYPVEVPESVVEQTDPEGIRLGAMKVLPRVNFDLRYDTNIYNQRSKIDDGVAVVRPSVRLQSDFSRHALHFDAAAEGRRYLDTSAENSNQWSLSGGGRLDFADRFVLDGDFGVARRIERRGTFGDQFFTDRPVSYNEYGGGLRLSRGGGIIEWQIGASSRKLDYNDARQNGLPVDQSFRDVRRDAVTFRVDYRRSDIFGLFVRATGNRLAYDIGTGRNSKGFSVVGGVSYRITDLVTAEAALGYVKQDTRDPARPDISAMDYHVSVSWTPTARTRFELKGERTVERSPLMLGSAVLQSTLVGNASIALGSRTLVGLEAGFLRNEYEGFDRRESRVFAEATVTRTISTRIAAFVGVSARRQRGSGINPREYDGAAVRLGARIAI